MTIVVSRLLYMDTQMSLDADRSRWKLAEEILTATDPHIMLSRSMSDDSYYNFLLILDVITNMIYNGRDDSILPLLNLIPDTSAVYDAEKKLRDIVIAVADEVDKLRCLEWYYATVGASTIVDDVLYYHRHYGIDVGWYITVLHYHSIMLLDLLLDKSDAPPSIRYSNLFAIIYNIYDLTPEYVEVTVRVSRDTNMSSW
jgi:hypothetical protein